MTLDNIQKQQQRKIPPQKKAWDGRFAQATADFVEQFTQSVSYDKRLAHYDILGSIAHVRMLAKTKIITAAERDKIIKGLMQIDKAITNNQFNWSAALEDVHMNIEAALIKRIGNVGKKLHTARSRNDQVATDLRLYLRDEIDCIKRQLVALIKALLKIAAAHKDTIMPGLTHLQVAQPVTFGHHILAWVEMLLRDRERLGDCYNRVNRLPLGAAALAGTRYPIDRAYVAKLLKFDSVIGNSVDAVSDRDFVIEFLSCASLIMMHLSRCSEELILWMTQANGFIELDDAWCTGSSIMPQKKNPDIPELVRGKAGRVYGSLMALLTLMKGQPLAYNRDNQEDKEPLFDAVDTTKLCLTAYTGLVKTIVVNKAAMYQAATAGFSEATDLADYLVLNGLAFRDAHKVAGKIVSYAIKHQKKLSDLSLKTLQQFSPVITNDVFSVLDLASIVAARAHLGGTAPEQVSAAITRIKKNLSR